MFEDSLLALRSAGRDYNEGVVLWLTLSLREPVHITDLYVPENSSSALHFAISPGAMRDVMRHLRRTRQYVAAQMHSHPGRAFHSERDDEQAIVRHEGALSIVVPRFADRVTTQNAERLCAFYTLTADDAWVRIPRESLTAYLEVEKA